MVMLPCCVQISPLSSINPSSMLIREIEYSPGLLSARMASRPSAETWPYFALHVRMALSMAAVALVGCDRLVSVDSSDGSSSLSAASADCGRCAAWQNIVDIGQRADDGGLAFLYESVASCVVRHGYISWHGEYTAVEFVGPSCGVKRAGACACLGYDEGG